MYLLHLITAKVTALDNCQSNSTCYWFSVKFWSTLYVGLQPNFTLGSFTTENLAHTVSLHVLTFSMSLLAFKCLGSSRLHYSLLFKSPSPHIGGH